MTFVLVRVDDGVATLTLSRPQAGNALNWAVFAQLSNALQQATDAPDVRAIVITGAGSRFSSGADVAYFVRYIEAGDVPRIIDSIRTSQVVFAQIADCPKPVVAAVQGAAVGGGVELALACHHIVATPRASFSFPETGLGILPASGGMYRTPRRIGVELTKWLVYTGHMLPPPKALKLGLIDRLVMPDQLADVARATALKLCDAAAAAQPSPSAPDSEIAALRELFARSSVAQLRNVELPDDRVLATAVKAIRERPLVTLLWAEKLIDAALACTPADSAAAALVAVPEIFGNPEVRRSLARVIEQQRRR